MPLSNFPAVKSNYSVIKIPHFDTTIISYGNKVEQRISNDSDPRYSYKLNFRALNQDDCDSLISFFLTCKGSFTAFYFQNPDEVYKSPIWQATHAYILNNIVRPITVNGHSYICTDAGTSDSGEPSWPTTVGDTVVDDGVIWTENSHIFRFAIDMLNADYFTYSLISLGEIELIGVSA